MADLSNPLTQITTGQAQKEVTANNLYDAMSPAALYGQNDLTTAGLTWGYYGGRFRGIAVAHGTVVLPASQASVYIVAALATGVVSQSTVITNWNDSTNYMRLYLATTGSSTITDWDDYREWVSSAAAGSGAAADQEAIQDIVGSLVVAGTGISATYDDASSPATLTIASTVASPPTTEDIQDVIAALVVAGSGISATYDDAGSPPTLTIGNTATSFSQEQVEDLVGALLVAGSNVTINYDDASSPATITIASTASGGGGGLTQENVEDIIGALIVAGTNVTVNYDDASSPATLTIDSTGGGGGGAGLGAVATLIWPMP